MTVLDASKDIEERTRKLFEVSRLHEVLIIAFDLVDVTPASRPIGMGRDFLGTCDLSADELLPFEGGMRD